MTLTYSLLLDKDSLFVTYFLFVLLNHYCLFCGFVISADKSLSDLKEFDSSFDAVADWLSATEARVSSLASSLPSSAVDADDTLDTCQTCMEELLQKQQDLDSVAAMARALCHGGVSSSRNVVQLNSWYSMITTTLKVKMLTLPTPL